MKKKGLIISTIVMVVVLIASLTTATYAWFNTSSVTSIEGFDVSIATNNAVKIGFKANNTYNAEATENDFATGSVTWEEATPGVIGGGTWTGDPGLSANVDHNIEWGEQSQAVGFRTGAIENLGKYLDPDYVNTEAANYVSPAEKEAGTYAPTIAHLGLGSLGATSAKTYVYAANGDASTLNNVVLAKANNDGSSKSDYVHILLGVAPTRTLTSSELIIFIDGNQAGTGTALGVLSAIHVAYRLNSSGAWTDVDVFEQYTQDNEVANSAGHYYIDANGYYVECTGSGSPTATFTKASNYHYNTLKSAVTCNLTTGVGSEAATYQSTYGSAAPTTGAYAVKITGLTTVQNQIDQIEFLVYIDGSDADCRQTAISNVAGSIKIFFHTTEA